MGNIPSFTPKALCKILEDRGFELKCIKGSHHYYQHPDTGKYTVVPMHKNDLPKGTFILSSGKRVSIKMNCERNNLSF